ncbi:DNA-binding protein [Helicobacter sp. MIT 00-7814]|uniref:XRE family transcriptional regulator n=1 Tax=unclassified Helicobacter TaxID=2593540 RepID=UPI000E1F5804|nr:MULTISPECIES: XRE family transcriptional regulator [unclassified Helicobacter]RDU53275.1 DNA-binding protein [Helicobacter sp. MIT 99-10781]RDU56972.1 DNA-binding protein [Helicobacter sp. MIT 00-7814]
MISAKLLAIRNHSGLSQKDFATQTGISYGTYQSYEYGNQSPRYDYLLKLSEIFKVPMTYFVEQNDSLVFRKSAQDDSLVFRESEQIRESNSTTLNDDVPQYVPQSDSTPQNPSKPSSILIPIFDDITASAGTGALNEEHISRYTSLDKVLLRDYFGLSSFLGLSIITARGDSMLPTIPENCQLLIQRTQSLQEGQICVVRLDDELYVKRLQKRPRYKLISDNKSYDDIELENENYEIVGIVIAVLKKII